MDAFVAYESVLRQESCFLGQVFAAAAREGLRGWSASPTRWYAAPPTAAWSYPATPAHLPGQRRRRVGAFGRGHGAGPADGTTLDRRALSKVRRGECGHEYVERRLAGFGVAVRRPGESGEAFLARALPAAGVVALRHGGCYGFRLGVTRAQRTAVRIAMPAGPYPKAIDDTSWRLATPLTAAVAPDVRTVSLR